LDQVWLEAFGYVGSVIVVLSLMMSNLARLRALNFVGSAIFTVYSAIIGAWPLLAVNGFIALVDVYFLVRLYFKKDYFSINEQLDGELPFVQKFLAFYAKDIARFYPDFDLASVPGARVILVSRNMNPVAIFIYSWEGPHVLRIHLDYALPAFRDLKSIRWLFNDKLEAFRRDGALQFVTLPAAAHRKYLKKMGFVPDQDGRTFRRAV
jgi:hypothetical protein